MQGMVEYVLTHEGEKRSVSLEKEVDGFRVKMGESTVHVEHPGKAHVHS